MSEPKKHHVTIIYGDGIGPEVVTSTRTLIDAACPNIVWETAEAGAEVFKKGIASGVPQETIDSLSRTRVALKGPLETPVGFGEKSANVTLRKLFETFANIRPVREFPGVPTRFSGAGIDMVIVRENVEDLYAGIEHMQTPDVAQCLKLISSKGCEKIMRTAFEFARSEGRKSVACATKANIMKKTEGLVKSTFERIAKEYPDIESWHIIIDNCAHQLAKKPEQFDVIVTTNMNGDIISDLGSGLIGGLGFAPGANIGHDVAIFEAVHGSAPKYAGKDTINPTAMILSGVMMLRYLGEFEAADKIENALVYTLESGVHPRDVVTDTPPVGTKAFTEAILKNFGKKPANYKMRERHPMKIPARPATTAINKAEKRETVGMDVFVEFDGTAAEIGPKLEAACQGTGFKLKMISNRGTVVYPLTGTSPDVVNQWRCRLYLEQPVVEPTMKRVNGILESIENQGLRWMHIEKLCKFDGVDSFTKAQGEN